MLPGTASITASDNAPFCSELDFRSLRRTVLEVEITKEIVELSRLTGGETNL